MKGKKDHSLIAKAEKKEEEKNRWIEKTEEGMERKKAFPGVESYVYDV